MLYQKATNSVVCHLGCEPMRLKEAVKSRYITDVESVVCTVYCY